MYIIKIHTEHKIYPTISDYIGNINEMTKNELLGLKKCIEEDRNVSTEKVLKDGTKKITVYSDLAANVYFRVLLALKYNYGEK